MATTVEAEVIPPRQGASIADLPRRVLASNGGAWFAWGFIAGLVFAGAAVYVVKKKM